MTIHAWIHPASRDVIVAEQSVEGAVTYIPLVANTLEEAVELADYIPTDTHAVLVVADVLRGIREHTGNDTAKRLLDEHHPADPEPVYGDCQVCGYAASGVRRLPSGEQVPAHSTVCSPAMVRAWITEADRTGVWLP